MSLFMRCTIDAQPILGRRTGIGAYVYEVLKRLPAFLRNDEICLTLFRFLKREVIPAELMTRNVTIRFHSLFPRKLLNSLFKMGMCPPFSLFSGESDVFLFPNFVTYPTGGKPAIVIIYDLSFLRYPEKAEKENQRFLSRFVPISAQKASAILTISDFSRDEIAETYNVPPERIRVAYPGVDTTVFHYEPVTKRIQEILTRYHLPDEYILFIGTLEPRKGIESLISAYETWEDQGKLPLVLIGKQGWGEIPSLIRALQGEIPGIFYPGYVYQQDLPLLLANARLFIYPSVYEGFGMPVLEAMACGTPVVCGECPSFHEIGGSLLTYCDSENPAALMAAISERLTLPLSPEKRQKMVQRARSFTWENTTQVIAETLKKIGNK